MNRLGRTKLQKEYFEKHLKCEICGRFSNHVHHINQIRSDDREENFMSLCQEHHTGKRGVHVIGVVRFCEQNRLTENIKWKKRYEISKLKYISIYDKEKNKIK